jgi:hypothetical protein
MFGTYAYAFPEFTIIAEYCSRPGETTMQVSPKTLAPLRSMADTAVLFLCRTPLDAKTKSGIFTDLPVRSPAIVWSSFSEQ